MRKTMQDGWTIAAIAGVIGAVVVGLMLGLATVGCAGSGDDGKAAGAQTPADKAEDERKLAELKRKLDEGEQDLLGPVVVGDGEQLTEFGLTGRGQGLVIPEDFPDDIPVLHEAQVTMVHRRGGQLMMGYVVAMPREAAVDALQTDMRDDGWWIEDRREDNGVTAFKAVNADDQARTARFTVGEHDKGRGALVVVTTAPR